jgi:hypothetical protein
LQEIQQNPGEPVDWLGLEQNAGMER